MKELLELLPVMLVFFIFIVLILMAVTSPIWLPIIIAIFLLK